MSTLQMVGHSDLTGKQFGSVRAVAMTSRSPAPRYHVSCARCGSTWIEDGTRLLQAGSAYRCRNGSCAATQEREFRHSATHGVPLEPTPEQQSVRSMRVDENSIGLLRAGISGVK